MVVIIYGRGVLSKSTHEAMPTALGLFLTHLCLGVPQTVHWGERSLHCEKGDNEWGEVGTEGNRLWGKSNMGECVARKSG